MEELEAQVCQIAAGLVWASLGLASLCKPGDWGSSPGGAQVRENQALSSLASPEVQGDGRDWLQQVGRLEDDVRAPCYWLTHPTSPTSTGLELLSNFRKSHLLVEKGS